MSVHAALVDALCAAEQVDGDWQDAFRAVPRELFVPDAVWTGWRGRLRLDGTNKTNQDLTGSAFRAAKGGSGCGSMSPTTWSAS